MNMMLNLGNGFELPTNTFLGERLAVIGASGLGKSNFIKVVIEENLKAHPALQVIIIDVEGEYWPLSEIRPFLKVGRGRRADVEVPLESLEALGRLSFEQRLSVILSLKHLGPDDYPEHVAHFLTGFWDAVTSQEEDEGHPVLVVIDEAHEFVPQQGVTPATKIINLITRRGRKWLVSLITGAQRAQDIAKSIISQAGLRAFFQALYPNDVEIYASNTPGWTKPQVREANDQLEIGQCIFVNRRQAEVVQVRQTSVYDAGAKRQMKEAPEPVIRPFDESLIAEIAASLAKVEASQPLPSGGRDLRSAALQTRIDELEETVEKQFADLSRAMEEIQRLTAQLAAVKNGNGFARLEVDQIHTQAIIAPAAGLEPASPVAAKVMQQLDEQVQARAAQNADRATRRAQRDYDTLVGDIIRKTSGPWLEVYAHLLVRETRQIGVAELCKDLHFKPATLVDRPPLFLIDQGLVCREGKGRSAIYWATTRKLLAERFEMFDTDEIYEQLLKAVCSVRT